LLQAFALLDGDDRVGDWRAAAAAAGRVDAGTIAARVGPQPAAIAQAIATARRAAIASALPGADNDASG
jgi:hypothetical protein